MIASLWSGQIRLLAKQKSNTCKMHQIAQFLSNSTWCILKLGPSFIKMTTKPKVKMRKVHKKKIVDTWFFPPKLVFIVSPHKSFTLGMGFAELPLPIS